MIDILLIFPPLKIPIKYPAIALPSLAAYLENHNISVKLCDAPVNELNEHQIKRVIGETMPGVVGITFMTSQFGTAKIVAKMVKNISQSIPVIVGGVHASVLPEETLRTCDYFDYVVYGEGELTLLEFMQQYLADRLQPDTIKGLVYRNNGEIIKNAPRELISDLDSLPMPAWHLLPVEKYMVSSPEERYSGVTGHGISICTCRGCPYNCLFCASHSVFQGYRYRS
ncbi:MAG: cobalamin-dependent protein, partial [Candidatus Hydrogenedentota bacterium]